MTHTSSGSHKLKKYPSQPGPDRDSPAATTERPAVKHERRTAKLASILAVAALVAAAATLIAQQNTGAPVVSEQPAAPPPKLPEITAQDLLDGFKNPARWLSYSGDYTGRRHSPLKQITPENVGRLAPQWTWQAEGMPINRGFESTPLVMDGTMYITDMYRGIIQESQ